jgi:hypothetical protein
MARACRMLLASLLVCSGSVPGVQLAQADTLPAPAHANVRMTIQRIHGPDSLAAGRYRIEVRAPRRGFGRMLLVKPDRGYTRAELLQDIVGAGGFPRLARNSRSFGGVEMHAGGTGVMWETLYAGRYWLLGFTVQRQRVPSVDTVHVHGSPTASSFPRVTAHATNIDHLGLRFTHSIPRVGRMLIRNRSSQTDSVVLMPLKRGFKYADLLRWIRRPRGEFPGNFSGIRRTMLLAPNAGFVLRYQLRPGTYVATAGRGFLGGPGRESPARLRRVIRPVTVH